MENSNVVFNATSHTYTYNGKAVPSVSQILQDEGFVDPKYFTEGGRDRGKAVHKAIEIYSRGAHCMRSKELEPYLDAFKNFQRDCEWEPMIIEVPMACAYYGGTADQFGLFRKEMAVLDIKSGVISPATGLQLSGYERLYWEYMIEQGVKDGQPAYVLKTAKQPALKRFALQVMDTGRYMLTEYKERNDRYIFDAAVACWWWKRNNRIGGRK